MVRLSDIAQRLGVSSATVSNAIRGKGRINSERRKLILRTAAEMGYLGNGVRSDAEGDVVIITEAADIDFTSSIINGITKACINNGYCYPIFDMGIISRGMQISSGADVLAPIIDETLLKLPPFTSGIIYISQYPRDITGLFQDSNIPVLIVYATGEEGQVSINYDDKQGSYLAVKHFINSGRRRIAMLSGPIDSKPMNNRLYGYQNALIEHGMSFDPKLVWIGDWQKDSGYRKTLEMLKQKNKPDAIFVQNDSMANGVLHALANEGIRVPEDIAVIGFDNTNMAEAMSPELSSIAPPFSQMGQTAVDVICKMINGESVKKTKILLPCDLVIRKST